MISGKGYAYGAVKATIPTGFALPRHESAVIQLVKAQKVLGKRHLEYCITESIKAFALKMGICNDLGMELLVRLSGSGQVGKAIKSLGAEPGDEELVLIAMGKSAKTAYKSALSQVNGKETIMKEHPLGEQLDAIERAALLVV